MSTASFTGLTDEEWNVIEPHIPFKWGIQHKGNPPMNPRKTINTILLVLKTGARWKDVPRGEQWASRSCAHKYLGIWMENGVLEKVLKALQEVGIKTQVIDLSRIAVDGFFSAGKGGGEEVNWGYKGKGVTTLP